MWNDVCNLGVVENKINDIGDFIEVINYNNEIYCNEKSIRASEFYQAQAVGMKPEVTLEISAHDYNKEKYVKYNEEEYRVLRTYKTSSERMELTLVRGSNNADS